MIYFTILLRRLSVKAILCAAFLSITSLVAFGASDVKKVKRIVARLQLEVMQLKEKSSKMASEQLALLEPQNAKIETLTRNNLKLSETIKSLKFKISILEEKLEEYQRKSSSSQLSELNQFATILALASVGETSTLESLVLDLINKGDNLQKDLLILLLAETQKNKGLMELSLGYYGALISDYPNSPYRSRSIFEASELLGKMGQNEEQKSLLLALKGNEDPYGEMAREKICHQLNIEDPVCGGVLYGELVGDEWVWFNNGDEKINSRYEGEIKNGVPNGKGTLYFPDGEKLEVEFKDGRF